MAALPASPRRRRATAALALALALPAALLPLPVRAAAFDVDALMALLAQRRSGEARFTEERTVTGLDAPLQASGRLTFTAPDRFARFTESPRAESMEVQGNTVLLRRGGRTRQTTLDAAPELAALADAMRGTLSGDVQMLRRHFRVEVAGSAAQWTLTLTPTAADLPYQVRLVEIAGQGPDVRRVDLRLVGGDRSVMRIEPLTPAGPRASSR